MEPRAALLRSSTVTGGRSVHCWLPSRHPPDARGNPLSGCNNPKCLQTFPVSLGDTPTPSLKTTGLGKAQTEKEIQLPNSAKSTSMRAKIMGSIITCQ